MGAAQFHKKLVSLLQTIKVTNLLIFILLLPSVNSAEPRRCNIDKCTKIYLSTRNADTNVEKCRLYISLQKCLEPYRVPCSGELSFYSLLSLNSQRMGKLNCNNLSTRSGETTQDLAGAKTNQCSFAGKQKFTFCSVFGDPHVRTFSDRFHTCKANGSWSLINNDYLVVKATNSLLEGRMEATAISKLVVMIRDSGACAKSRTYIAEIGQDLTGSFTDGTNHTGLEKSVNVIENEAGKEIQISIRFIGTTIVIRNAGTHLSISIQMPEEIANSPIDKRKQMCVKGCPKRQRIRLSHEINRLMNNPKTDVPPARKYSEHEARIKCRDALLEQIAETEQPERSKRSTYTPKNKRKNNNRRQDRNFDVDPAATTWKQLSQSQNEGDITDARVSPRKRGKKYRQTNRRKSRRTSRPRFSGLMHDDPASYDQKEGRRGRGRVQVSSVERGANYYFEACVFDLMTTGDITYASSARGAFNDVTRFHRSGSKAKGASMKVVDNWTFSPITASPTPKATKIPASATVTKRVDRGKSIDPGNRGSRTITHINIFVLIICLFSSSYVFHISQLFEVYNLFFKVKRGTT